MKFSEILKSKKSFPCKITNHEGKQLKNYFDLDINSINQQKAKNTIIYKYIKKIENSQYVLIEEYLFREGEIFLDIKRAITTNYYLNRE